MPRKPRIHYPGAVYHVILRGNAGHDVFLDDSDRYRFYLLLQQGTERFHHRIHAFCLMTNHVHLLIQVTDIPLSRVMQNLTLRYTTWINRRHRRIGHLFHGRYKAILIDADTYLLELVRYVHLNPVRAAMVKAPEEYPWSGHRALVGKEIIPWLTTDSVLSFFGKETRDAVKKYNAFVRDALGEGARLEFGNGTHEGRILGDDSFADEALRTAEQKPTPKVTIDALLVKVCRHFDLSEKDLSATGKTRPASEARALAAYLVRESGHLSLTTLAERLKREVSALSQAARRLEKQIREEPLLAEQVSIFTANLQMSNTTP